MFCSGGVGGGIGSAVVTSPPRYYRAVRTLLDSRAIARGEDQKKKEREKKEKKCCLRKDERGRMGWEFVGVLCWVVKMEMKLPKNPR